MFQQDLLLLLKMEAESVEGPQQMVRYRAGRETGGLDLEETEGV